MKFNPIVLPATYKRSHLARQLRRRVNPFANLLAQLAPRKYARVASANSTGFDYYIALCSWCSQYFPVWIPDYFADEFDDEGELNHYLLSFGIPVDPLGVEDEALEEGFSATLGVIAYLLNDVSKRVTVEELITHHRASAWTRHGWLRPWWASEIDVSMFNPPRGREWVGRWKNLPWLLRYIYHDTGYQWLDVCSYDLDEGGNPPWTLADIKFLTQDWADAKRIWQPLKAFMNWLDAAPSTRLPIALATLTGDQQVRREISRPKHTKTLAEVFDAEDKKAQRAHARVRA